MIYGGGLYAAGINGVKLITQNFSRLKGKKLIVFATGATPVREETTAEIRNKNISGEQQKHIQFFYLRGGFDYSKLTAFDKVLMTLLKWNLKRKKELTLDEKGMLAAYSTPVDFTKKKYIAELISSVKQSR